VRNGIDRRGVGEQTNLVFVTVGHRIPKEVGVCTGGLSVRWGQLGRGGTTTGGFAEDCQLNWLVRECMGECESAVLG
jgi:hypothetical protein